MTYNYDDIIESQFVFAKNSETSEICLLIKLNLNNLSESIFCPFDDAKVSIVCEHNKYFPVNYSLNM